MRNVHTPPPIQGALGVGGHHTRTGDSTDDWLTPPFLIEALGPFDLDPCTPESGMPWPTATTMHTPVDGGLFRDWDGFVWLNPPYGRATGDWLARLATHPGGGIALIFARTETDMFQRWVFGHADLILFLAGRLNFHYPNGDRCPTNSGAPSVLIGYGDLAVDRIRRAHATHPDINGAIWTPESSSHGS